MKINDKNIVVTGGAGFLGRFVVRALRDKGVKKIRVPRSSELDLRNRDAAKKAVEGADVVIHLAAQIGGIGYISKHPGEMFYNNIVMGVELMEAARVTGVTKFISIGTVCEYPRIIPLPFKEKNLWDGYPDESTASYGWAKKMLIVQGKAYREQYGFHAVHLLPVNLYGPEDNFDRDSAHVIPSLIRKIIEARDSNNPFVEVWGSGRASREFLYVEDAASGIVLATEKYDGIDPINLGSGQEIKIKDVVAIIMQIVGYTGSIKWNSSMPDGQPRRQLDVTKAKKLFDFEAKTSLEEGLRRTINWYSKQ